MDKKYICPWCGSEEITYGVQNGAADVRPAKPIAIARENLIHVICKKCGTVIRSYIEKPQKF